MKIEKRVLHGKTKHIVYCMLVVTLKLLVTYRGGLHVAAQEQLAFYEVWGALSYAY